MRNFVSIFTSIQIEEGAFVMARQFIHSLRKSYVIAESLDRLILFQRKHLWPQKRTKGVEFSSTKASCSAESDDILSGTNVGCINCVEKIHNVRRTNLFLAR